MSGRSSGILNTHPSTAVFLEHMVKHTHRDLVLMNLHVIDTCFFLFSLIGFTIIFPTNRKVVLLSPAAKYSAISKFIISPDYALSSEREYKNEEKMLVSCCLCSINVTKTNGQSLACLHCKW